MPTTQIDGNNPGQVAHELARLTVLLEERTEDYAEAIETAARTDASFKRHWALALLDVVQEVPPRTTVAVKDAMVEVRVNDERVTAEITNAHAKAVKESLLSIRKQIDALQSLSASLRAQT